MARGLCAGRINVRKGDERSKEFDLVLFSSCIFCCMLIRGDAKGAARHPDPSRSQLHTLQGWREVPPSKGAVTNGELTASTLRPQHSAAWPVLGSPKSPMFLGWGFHPSMVFAPPCAVSVGGCCWAQRGQGRCSRVTPCFGCTLKRGMWSSPVLQKHQTWVAPAWSPEGHASKALGWKGDFKPDPRATRVGRRETRLELNINSGNP